MPKQNNSYKQKLLDAIKTLQLDSDVSFDMQYWEDTDGNILYISPACKRITGYSADEFINTNKMLESIIYLEDLDRWNLHHTKQEKGKIQKTEFRINHKNGGIVWIEHLCQPLLDEENNLIGYRGSNRDITTRKLTSEIYKTSPTVLFMWDNEPGWPVLFVSENIKELTGYSQNDFLTSKISYMEIIHPLDLEWVSIAVKENLIKEIDNVTLKSYRIVTKSGETKWIKDTTIAKKNSSGVIINYLGSITDITTLKNTEQELQKSENSYRAFVENTSDALYISDMKGRFVDVNYSACNLLKYSREELLSLSIPDVDVNFPKDKLTDILGSLEFGIPKIIESIHKKKNGEVFPVEVRIRAFGMKDNPLFLSSARDISLRTEVESALLKSRKKYEDLFKKSSDATLIIHNGRFIDCNAATVKLLGYSDITEFLQKHPSELSPKYQPDGQQSDIKADEMINIALKNGSHRFEWIHQKVDKTNFPVEVLLTPITNEDGSIIIHTVWRDITERKRHEKLQKSLFAISEEANKNTSVDEFYKIVHDIINELMPAKNIYIAIHNAETDIIKFPYFVDIHDPSPVKRKFSTGLTERVLSEKKSQIISGYNKIRKTSIIKEGDKYPKQWVGIYLEFEGKYKGVLILQDYDSENAYTQDDLKILQFVAEQIVRVVDKKFADERLLKSLKELSAAKNELELINSNKNKFFSIIAHDLRSPFMALMGISQMITENMDDLELEEIKLMTSTIYNSTQNLYKLIENLLTWSQLQMESYVISPSNIDIRENSVDTCASLQLAVEAKRISLENNIEKVEVFADANCVKSILRNLISNAIKYTKRDNGYIVLSSAIIDGAVKITVEDNGIGMRKPILDNLFSITDKVSELGTEKEVGTGLGLILCKELVEKNNGKIWAESEVGKGSKFIFTLPLKQMDKLLGEEK